MQKRINTDTNTNTKNTNTNTKNTNTNTKKQCFNVSKFHLVLYVCSPQYFISAISSRYNLLKSDNFQQIVQNQTYASHLKYSLNFPDFDPCLLVHILIHIIDLKLNPFTKNIFEDFPILMGSNVPMF